MCCFFIFCFQAGYGQSAPPLLWKFKAAGPFIASPVIDSGLVFCSSLDSNLYAMDMKTGVQKWRFNTGAANRSTVLVHGRVLYLLGGNATLYCLDKRTGKKQWTFKTGGEKKYSLYGFADHFQSSPMWNEGRLYFGSGDGNIYALEAKTGGLLWKFATQNVVHTTPAVQRDKVLVGSFDGYFYALNKNTGALIWRFKSVGQRYFPAGEFQGSPAVAGNTVYVGSRDFNLYALNIEKGVCNWNRYFSNGWSISTPSFYKNLVINGTSDDRALMAMDTARGTIAWQVPAGFNIFGSCLVVDSTGYFGTLNGKLFSIDLTDGKIRWVYHTDGNTAHHDDYLLQNDQYNEQALSLLRQDLSAQVQMFYRMGGIFSKPAKEGNRLLFSAADNTLYCLQLSSGL